MILITLEKKHSENIVEKGQSASNQHFLLFTCFPTILETNPTINLICNLLSVIWTELLPIGKKSFNEIICRQQTECC